MLVRCMRAAAIALCALAAGCGGDDRAPEAASTPAGPCPEGTPPLTARDVIGPAPKGFDVTRGDRKAIAAFIAPLEQSLGDRWRGYDARVVARRGAANGAAVIVINSSEKTGGADDVIAGAEEASRESGRPLEPIAIAGSEGRISRAADGGYLAVANVADCSVVLLVGDTEPLVRGVARVLPDA